MLLPRILFAFLFIFSLSANSQNFEWAVGITGNGQKESSSIVADDSGYVYTVGLFRNDIDLDPGVADYFLSSSGDEDIFIQKIDSAGNFVWGKSIGGTGQEQVTAMAVDINQNIYISGTYFMSMDADPGLGVFTINTGSYGMFLIKINRLGDLIYVRNWEPSYALSIAIDADENVYMTGSFDNLWDADPTVGVFNLDPNGEGSTSSAFFIKLNSSGNLAWAKNVHCVPYTIAEGSSIYLGNSGDFYVTGWFQDTVDFDPGIGQSFLATPLFKRGAFIEKFDTSGNFVWVKGIISDDYVHGIDIVANNAGEVYAMGVCSGNTDIDPGPAVENIFNADPNYYIVKLDNSGQLIWYYTITTFADFSGSIALDTAENIVVHGKYDVNVDLDPGIGLFYPTVHNSNNPTSMFIQTISPTKDLLWAWAWPGLMNPFWGDALYVDAEGSIFTTGFFYETTNVHPESSGIFELISTSGYEDIFVHKISQSNCSTLELSIDSTANATCLTNGFANVNVVNGAPPYNYSWNTTPPSTDTFIVVTGSGLYTVSVTDRRGCETKRSAVISGVDINTATNFDLNTNLIATEFRSGFPATLWIDAFNKGCVPVTGELSIILSSLVTYNNAFPPPDNISGDTLRWNFTSLTLDSSHITPRIEVTTDVLPIWETVCFDLKITPTNGDLDSINNIKTYCYGIVNGYDPNDKAVYPIGKCAENYVLPTEKLTYTIRFQNTGNSHAINITIVDTLDFGLDSSTVRIVGQSHDLITELLPGNILNFKFNNINLIDSATNPVESQGYVIFEVSQKSTIDEWEIIENSCGIYFDFNAPIITNTVFNTSVNSIPQLIINQFYTICAGDSVVIGPNVHYTAGTHPNYFISIDGCDSIVNAVLNVLPTPSFSQNLTLCFGEYTTVGGNQHSTTGIFYDTLLAMNGCDSIITTNLTITPLADTSVTSNGITLTSNESAAFYQWIDCSTGTNVSGATGQNFTPTTDGNYAVILSYSNCSDTSYCYPITVSGIFDLSSSQIKIYYDQMSHSLNITSTVEIQHVELYDLQGKLILSKEGKNNLNMSLEISTIPAGMYFVRLYANEKTNIAKFSIH